MKRLLLFAGTSEGRLLAEALVDQPIEVTACAATEYGRELLPDGGQVHARAGRLSLEEMTELTRTGGFDWAVDATHPYADQATANIRKAARAAGLPYLRLTCTDESLRPFWQRLGFRGDGAELEKDIRLQIPDLRQWVME